MFLRYRNITIPLFRIRPSRNPFQIQVLPKLFKIYKDFHLYAGVATLVTNDALIAKAQELGLFLLTQQGDHTTIVQTGRLLH